MAKADSKELFKIMRFDKPLFFIMLILIILGLVMVFSSTAVLAAEQYQNSFHFLLHQGIGIGLGFVMLFAMIIVRKPFYEEPLFVCGLLFLSLILLALCFVMPAVGNTNRWISLGALRFQPSELSKFSLILFFAFYFSRKQERIAEWSTLFIPLSVLGLSVLLILKEPDFGTAMLIFLICTAMLYIGGVRATSLLALGTVAASIFAIYLIQASYRMERIFSYLSPDKDPQGVGFQAIQSKVAVGSGGLFGVSLGESTQKLFFLPCAHTDYIYAIIGEELGLFGTLSILLLFSVFLWRGILISRRAPNLCSQMAAAGLTIAIFVQAVLNISIVLGLAPATGLPLPLVSFGRSSLLSTIFGIGILLHISQRRPVYRMKK